MNKETRQQLEAIWARVERLLEDALPEISALMAAEFAAIGTPVPDSSLDQAGLQDGAEIVKDYMLHNELGLALEHLCYMVREPGLPISEQTYASLEAAGREMHMDAIIWQDINPLLHNGPSGRIRSGSSHSHPEALPMQGRQNQ